MFFAFKIATNSYAQSCDRLYRFYDSLDTYNLVNDSERKIRLNQLLVNCQDDEFKIGYWQRLGLIYDKHRNDDSALYFYNKALKLIDISKQFGYLNSVLMNIGNIYIRLNLYEKAIEYYNLDTMKRLKGIDNYNKSVYYYNRADLYLKMGKVEKAWYNYNNSVFFTDTLNDLNEKFSLNLLQSDIHRCQKKFKNAFNSIKHLYKYRFKDINEDYRVSFYSMYAFTLSYLSKDNKVNKIADTAIILARKLDNDIVLTKTIEDMANVFLKLGDTIKAFRLFTEWKNLNDSLLKMNLIEGIKLAEFEIQEELISKELKIQKERVILQNTKLYYSLIGIFFLLIFTIIGFLYYRQRQKINKQNLQIKDAELNQIIREQELSFLNAQLSGQINERKRIATELHNSLGNRLASIKLGFESLGVNKTSSQKEIEKIIGLNEQIDEACSKLRLISHVQYDQAWLHELQQQLNSISQTHGIKTTLIDNGINLSNNMQLEMDLYTISEGLLSNSIKHSGASEITIQLNKIDDNISYSYEDNGKGFQSEILEQSDGIGYRILNERVVYHNGKWNLDTAPGQGMIIFIEFPLIS